MSLSRDVMAGRMGLRVEGIATVEGDDAERMNACTSRATVSQKQPHVRV